MLDRSQAPLSGEIKLLEFPDYLEHQLPNGVQVVSLNQGSQPVLLLEIEIPVGRWEEPKEGLAYYLGRMLTEGTRNKTAAQIASAFDFYGSHLEVVPTLDGISIKLYTLNRFFPDLMPLLVELLTESVFPEKEFLTQKKLRVEQVRQQFAKNNVLASLKFREALFGSTHPYGQVVDEHLAIQATREDLVGFSPAILTAPKLFIGGMVRDRELDILADHMGQIAFTEPKSRKVATVFQSANEPLQIERQGSAQASIRMGHASINRNAPEIHAFKIANELLGGFFGSRLMKNIREEKGLTYGIHSSSTHLQESSYWQISTEVLSEKAELALAEIQREIELLQNEPPTSDELRTVTNYMKGKFLTSFDTPFNSMSMIKGMKMAGLGKRYFQEFLATLDSITPQQVSETAQRHMHLDCVEVRVG